MDKCILIFLLIFLTGLSVLGFILDFYLNHKITSDIRKKKIGLYILIIVIVAFIGNTIIQIINSDSLDRNIETLLEKSNNDSINLISLKQKNDSQAIQLQLLGNSNDSLILKVLELNRNLNKGFDRNKKSIDGLKLNNYRKLGIKTKQSLTSLLSKYENHEVMITYMMDSEESNQLANQFRDVFNDAGWKSGFSFAMYPPNFKDVRFYSRDDKNLLKSIGTILLDSDLKFKLSYDKKILDNKLTVIIGYR